jgi:hypothetical protein
MLVIFLLICTLGVQDGCRGEKETSKMDSLEKLPDIKERLAKYAPVEMTYDESLLNEEQKQVLEKLIQAAKHMDTIFWKQAYPQGLAIKEELERSKDPADKDYLRFLKSNFGLFDRQDENKPFIGTDHKPPGAGFYPSDLTKGYFQGYIDGNPNAREALQSEFTVIKKENGTLIAIPYNEEYRENLEPAAQNLKEAAEITTNPSLKNYLSQKADDLLSNDYYQSDVQWIDLKDNQVEIVIGPYEVYEDNLMGLKAAYESFVYINDQEEMEKLKGYLDYIGEMQKNLPVEQKYKDQEVTGLKSPLNVVIQVFSAGDTKAGIQTLAFVLPNDARIRDEKGTKKVFLKNVMEAKFNKILTPISKKVLSSEDSEHVSFYAYYNEVILHEICHVLGLNYVTKPDGTKITLNQALKEHLSAIEEAKATVAGLYNIDLLMDEGWIPKDKEREIYTTYLAGMFRSMRFGVTEAHGLSALIQFNFHREKGAFIYDEETGKFSVNMDTAKDSIRELTQALLILEGDGDYDKAAAFITQYSDLDEFTEKTIESLKDIPVDIQPIYKF